MPEGHQASVHQESEAGPVTVLTLPRTVIFHRVMPEELENLISGGLSLHIYIGFFGVALGALLTIITILSTTTLGDRLFAGYIAGLLVSLFFTLQCSVRIYIEWRKVKNKIREIKMRQAGDQVMTPPSPGTPTAPTPGAS